MRSLTAQQSIFQTISLSQDKCWSVEAVAPTLFYLDLYYKIWHENTWLHTGSGFLIYDCQNCDADVDSVHSEIQLPVEYYAMAINPGF